MSMSCCQTLCMVSDEIDMSHKTARTSIRVNQYCMYCSALVLFLWLCTWTGNNACSLKSYSARSLLSRLSVLAFLLHKHADFPFPRCSLCCMAVNKCQKHALKQAWIVPPPQLLRTLRRFLAETVWVIKHYLKHKTARSPCCLCDLSGRTRPRQHWGCGCFAQGPSVCAGWFHGERQRLALSLFSDHPGLSRWEINKRLGPSQSMQTQAPLRKSDREEVYDGQKEMANQI